MDKGNFLIDSLKQSMVFYLCGLYGYTLFYSAQYSIMLFCVSEIVNFLVGLPLNGDVDFLVEVQLFVLLLRGLLLV